MAGALVAAVGMSGALALAGLPAYGQSAGVGNAGDAAATTGGNVSTGNASTNVAGNTTTRTDTEPTVVGSLLGVVLNLTAGSANASTGTSAVSTGEAQASGNNSDSTVAQSGDGGVVGTVFSPFFAPAQAAEVSNSGGAVASTGGNVGTGNASTNVASNDQTVSAGLIAVGLTLGSTATNTSSGTSTINTGPASAAGNTATNAVSQEQFGGFGPGVFGIGGGFHCAGGFFGPGQVAAITNSGTGAAATGDNISIGNASTNVAATNVNSAGGLIDVDVPGLLGLNSTNASDGASVVVTGPAAASGNTATNAVDQECVHPAAAFRGPPVITPPAFHPGPPPVVHFHPHKAAHRTGQLARTGVDPFLFGVVSFVLLFGGLLFLVWERVEAYPTARS